MKSSRYIKIIRQNIKRTTKKKKLMIKKRLRFSTYQQLTTLGLFAIIYHFLACPRFNYVAIQPKKM